MVRLMIIFYQPRPELAVELMQEPDFFMAELDQKAVAHGAKKAFDFAFAFRAVGLAGDFSDSQLGADKVNLMSVKYLTVIHIKDFRDAAFEDGFMQGIFQMWQIFLPVEFGVGRETGVIIDQGDKIGAPGHGWAVRIRQERGVHDGGLPGLVWGGGGGGGER